MMEKKIVLVIDDDENIIREIRDFLELGQFGYRVIFAKDGLSGINKVRQAKPDIILLDLVLPDKSGFRIAQEIKSIPEYADIPIIAISLKKENIDKHVALKSGIVEYIEKPIDYEKLLVYLKDIC